MKKTHLVNVLGREIPVKSASSEEKVREVEAFVNERLREIQSRLSSADPQLVASLALLNLAESYLDLKSRSKELESIDRRMGSLLERLEKNV